MADRNLELGVIGNCAIAALIDQMGSIIWSCFPRLDGDPVFCALLDNDGAAGEGAFAIELKDVVGSTQRYLDNSAILETILRDAADNAVEITDYPKAGDPNPVVQLGIVTIARGTTTWLDLSGYTGDTLIVDVDWHPDSMQVLAQVQDREQTWLDLISVSAATGVGSTRDQAAPRTCRSRGPDSGSPGSSRRNALSNRSASIIPGA